MHDEVGIVALVQANGQSLLVANCLVVVDFKRFGGHKRRNLIARWSKRNLPQAVLLGMLANEELLLAQLEGILGQARLNHG